MSAMPFDSISALRDHIVSGGAPAEAYASKMLHRVPDLPVVKDRKEYLVSKAKSHVVFDIGCTGPISEAIRGSAARYYGVDKIPTGDTTVLDVDTNPDLLPLHEDVDIVVLSEVLEHLSNPGDFLKELRAAYPGRLVYITVPNAGACRVKDGLENVNKDHVCWYSYTTLKTLLTRYGYEVLEARWYNGDPYIAEGLIMVVT